MSAPSYLEMSSGSTNVGEAPHYAYLVLRMFPPFPTEMTALCHHAITNDMFLFDGRVGPSPLPKINNVDIFLMETLILQIRFRLPFDAFNRMLCTGNKPVKRVILKKKNLYMLQMWFLETSSTTLEILVVLKQL
jgi:hypothetical protein